ncbi:MAG: hypothetical protein HY22_08615 [[Candidatus Thermochlorobacteriaceae] bacterium GBChlB]|nr:MAG: hypothetical protein HY22_08615 [[Candidatus Thermochlorobacteriaceae] bacterium GBChlB]
MNAETTWVDAGCGNNIMVEGFGGKNKYAVGVDVETPEQTTAPFVKADLKKLPFEDNSADLVTLRFVVEHLPSISEDFADIVRVLKKGGEVVVLTTNLRCPFIFTARLIPFAIKNTLIQKLFKVSDDDVFKTYHQLNSPAQFQRGIDGLKLKQLIFISDLNSTRKPVFLLFLAWHILTMPKFLHSFRMNILGVYEKT